jgi:hypothetical protein
MFVAKAKGIRGRLSMQSGPEKEKKRKARAHIKPEQRERLAINLIGCVL